MKNGRLPRRHGDLFVLTFVLVFAIGWLLEIQYFSLLEQNDYQPCEKRSSGVRSVFITYTKDMSLCQA